MGETPYKTSFISRTRKSAAIVPPASPINTWSNPCRKTICKTAPRLAPSAIRIPISWVRWFTENASTPPIPAAVMTSASSANKPSNVLFQPDGDHELSRPDLVERLNARDRLLRIDPPNRFAQFVPHTAGRPVRSDHERAGGQSVPGPKRKMNFVLRVGIDLRTRIRDETDDRGPVFPVIERDPLSNRILARPVTAGERLIDDHHLRRFAGVAALEKATTQQRLADGLEIIFAADQNKRRRRGGVRLRVAVLDCERRRIIREPIQR